jgi:hypothetical protein
MMAFFFYCLLILIPFVLVVALITRNAPDIYSFIPPLIMYLLSSFVAYPYYALSKDKDSISGATLWGWRWRKEQISLREISHEKVLRQNIGKKLGIIILYSTHDKKILTLGLSNSQLSQILEAGDKQ